MGGILRQEPPGSSREIGIGAIDLQPGGVKPRPAKGGRVVPESAICACTKRHFRICHGDAGGHHHQAILGRSARGPFQHFGVREALSDRSSNGSRAPSA